MDTILKMSMLDMSTRYLTEETRNKMCNGEKFPFIYSVKAVDGVIRGFFVHIPGETDIEEDLWPQDMLACARFANSVGAEWIHFDEEGSYYGDLAAYDTMAANETHAKAYLYITTDSESSGTNGVQMFDDLEALKAEAKKDFEEAVKAVFDETDLEYESDGSIEFDDDDCAYHYDGAGIWSVFSEDNYDYSSSCGEVFEIEVSNGRIQIKK